jgi:hypothetical protein
MSGTGANSQRDSSSGENRLHGYLLFACLPVSVFTPIRRAELMGVHEKAGYRQDIEHSVTAITVLAASAQRRVNPGSLLR